MKKIPFMAIIVFMAATLHAQQKTELNKWLRLGPKQIHQPVFSGVKNINGDTYSDADLMEHIHFDFAQTPGKDVSALLMDDSFSWQAYEIPADSVVASGLEGHNVLYMTTYLKTDQWSKLRITLSGNALFEAYIDGEKKHAKKHSGKSNEVFTVELHEGNHQLMLKVLGTGEQIRMAGTVSAEGSYEALTLENTVDPTRALNIYDILNGTDIESSSISPSGRYALVSYAHSRKGSSKDKEHHVIMNLNTMKQEMVLREPDISHVRWLPSTDRLSYTQKYDDAHNLYLYDPEQSEEKVIARNISNLSYYRWAPNEQYILYSRSREADDPGELKRIYGNEDRIPGFRDRSFLHLLEVESGHRQQITAGNLSASLHDISPDSRKILFSTTYPDYTEVPFSKQNLYEMDLQSFEADTIWKDKPYSGRAEYSPDGKALLVQGPPQLFGDKGVNTADDQLPNSYDGQLYLYQLEGGQVTPLTKNFSPAVGSAEWINQENIYLSVTEKDYSNLYRYSTEDESFQQIDLQVEVMGDIDFARNNPHAIYRGTGMTQPEKLYMLDLSSDESILLDAPKNEELQDVAFGPTEDWNFTNSRGTVIDGRVYYPPEYDPEKEYPVIVYYYGGTTPVSRSFDGRYPKNIWAGKGYIVYVLQPSGAIGYGQQFSALHVNGWGKEAIDDIIEGTNKFLDAHPSADEDNVGAIGASYGGFTTMLLQTRTNLFKTAVSHAGISSITSYWGEGYWGYTYSAGASTYSYPWNNKELYVENSPLYNADDFNNSILLLHGTADTNVPVGESKQYYAALKILGKDVEMVLVEDENHWIVDYDKRIKWHHTITSWFDKKLKGEKGLWNHMYPEKHLQ